MSGHSKWKNIMHKKEKTDAQRAKVFTKIGKEMAIAIKEGGPDPASNSKLRDLIQKAKANNVPNDNIERVIKKFSGNNDVNYEEVNYEGYGPCGVAVIVRAATDNRNRTGGNVRHYFDKFGGNLGQNGCVSYLFDIYLIRIFSSCLTVLRSSAVDAVLLHSFVFRDVLATKLAIFPYHHTHAQEQHRCCYYSYDD